MSTVAPVIWVKPVAAVRSVSTPESLAMIIIRMSPEANAAGLLTVIGEAESSVYRSIEARVALTPRQLPSRARRSVRTGTEQALGERAEVVRTGEMAAGATGEQGREIAHVGGGRLEQGRVSRGVGERGGLQVGGRIAVQHRLGLEDALHHRMQVGGQRSP